MKRGTNEREFVKIKKQFKQIGEIVRHTKANALWEHEAAVRKKIKALKEYEKENFKDYKSVYKNYIELLEYISIMLYSD
jgi:ATP-dependent RNA helicase SUPV3L1/SUV3